MSEFPEMNLRERLHNMELVLKPTQPKGYSSYYNIRQPLVGKEISIGSIEKTDMLANDTMCWTILEFFYHAQFDVAFDLMTYYQNDWKASMSIGGELLKSITNPEYRYVQTQEIHDYQHPIKKPGLLSWGNKNAPRD